MILSRLDSPRTSGDLVGALERSPVPDRTLRAAGDIIVALLGGGPAQDIDDYESGARDVDLAVGEMIERAGGLGDYLAIHAIQSFLEPTGGADREWRSARGWTPEVRERLLQRCQEILTRPRWRELATEGLESPDELEFRKADQVARHLGLDRLSVHLRRLLGDHSTRVAGSPA